MMLDDIILKALEDGPVTVKTRRRANAIEAKCTAAWRKGAAYARPSRSILASQCAVF